MTMANTPQTVTVKASVDTSLGLATTRDLLEELRLRGDLAMTVFPASDRGADGAVLSAIAGATLRASSLETLEAIRGK
jgi:hypothetical protein